ncbi:transposase [Streptomyces mirabilis]|uniref:transposase n=1 Tax=Streptomyces mirabilis TaxID=68239 RepID=UPI0036E48F70
MRVWHRYCRSRQVIDCRGRSRDNTVLEALTPSTLSSVLDTSMLLLRSLQATITQLETTIKKCLARHPRAVLLAQLPGVGTINLAQLLAEVGPILDRVESAEQAAAECGAAPLTKASGKAHGVYFRWAANTRARKAVTAFAHNSRMQSPWAAAHAGNATRTPPASSPARGSASYGPAGTTAPPTTLTTTPPPNVSKPADLTQRTQTLRGPGGLPPGQTATARTPLIGAV